MANRDAWEEYIEHPNWFESPPFFSYDSIYQGIPIYYMTPERLESLRKPIPFVLPLKGASNAIR